MKRSPHSRSLSSLSSLKTAACLSPLFAALLFLSGCASDRDYSNSPPQGSDTKPVLRPMTPPLPDMPVGNSPGVPHRNLANEPASM